jgi:hypothetical protein
LGKKRIDVDRKVRKVWVGIEKRLNDKTKRKMRGKTKGGRDKEKKDRGGTQRKALKKKGMN